MICSMTGFGRCELSSGLKKVSVEIKSVNHRYLDVSIKMPKKFNVFENKIRDELKKYASRGKIDIFISYVDLSKGDVNVRFNEGVAEEYYEIFKNASNKFNLENDLTTSTLLRLPEVLTMEEECINEDEIWEFLLEALTKAFSDFRDARVKEGEKLKVDLLNKLEDMKKDVNFITERSPQIIAEYKQKLLDKINEAVFNVQIDESRIATEVTIYADKVCVDEELVRLNSHIDAVAEALSSDESVGRRLDFLAQEMNREANTTLSKSNDVEVSNAAIELKTCIEKIREQIQNIE
ncbi:YicC/YloC family endoribonuclease [uncultured Eubacterium sp.]|uniref:YicC/YloC family endoribonuclease n=1 Tax=uncultured Eubacterium sp. TaxID=165185 RepID=UPI0025956FA2|nr:YicC/YloC family endoribonuclease [uncultured Eubacterium sp.]